MPGSNVNFQTEENVVREPISPSMSRNYMYNGQLQIQASCSPVYEGNSIARAIIEIGYH